LKTKDSLNGININQLIPIDVTNLVDISIILVFIMPSPSCFIAWWSVDEILSSGPYLLRYLLHFWQINVFYVV